MGISMVSSSTAVRYLTDYETDHNHDTRRAIDMRQGVFMRRVMESRDSTPFAQSVAENSIAGEVVDLYTPRG